MLVSNRVVLLRISVTRARTLALALLEAYSRAGRFRARAWASQTQLLRHFQNLVVLEHGHLLGHLERPLSFHVSLGEDQINLLKLASRCLGIEKVRKRHGQEVDQGKEEVDAPAAAVREDGREHDDGKVGQPVCARRERRRTSTCAKRVDLRRVDPRQRQDGKGEERDKEENAHGSAVGVGWRRVDQAGHGDDEAEALAQEPDQVQLATADSLNHEEGWEREDGVDGGKDTAQNQRHAIRHVEVLLEEQGRVVDGGVAAGELLEELAGAANHHALELLRLAKREQRLPVRLVVL